MITIRFFSPGPTTFSFALCSFLRCSLLPSDRWHHIDGFSCAPCTASTFWVESSLSHVEVSFVHLSDWSELLVLDHPARNTALNNLTLIQEILSSWSSSLSPWRRKFGASAYPPGRSRALSHHPWIPHVSLQPSSGWWPSSPARVVSAPEWWSWFQKFLVPWDSTFSSASIHGFPHRDQWLCPSARQQWEFFGGKCDAFGLCLVSCRSSYPMPPVQAPQEVLHDCCDHCESCNIFFHNAFVWHKWAHCEWRWQL